MKKRFVLSMFLPLIFAVLVEAAPQKKRVAVLDFDFASVQKWWEHNWDIGKGVSDLVVKNLVRDGRYSVIERRALDIVLAEQNFSNSDRANASTAAQIGHYQYPSPIGWNCSTWWRTIYRCFENKAKSLSVVYIENLFLTATAQIKKSVVDPCIHLNGND